MASFDSTTPVLRFRLPWRDYSVHKWLLWPTFGWQVVAPRGKPRNLNVLQKAVLGLSHRSSPGIDKMASRLDLGPDLVAFIVSELSQLGWIDGSGRITALGVRIFEAEQTEPQAEQTVGWVFSDPFTGQVWPRFIDGDLPFIETETNESGRIQPMASPGEGKGPGAFNVVPLASHIVQIQPTGTDVVRACRSHRRQYGWESELEVEDAPAISRVSYLSGTGTPFFLLVRAWRDQSAEWHVDDPFGVGESLRLRGQIERGFDTFGGLRAWLAPIAGGDVADTDIQSLQVRARWDVEQRLTVAIHRWPFVAERLVAMQRARLEVELEASPLDKWDDVGVKAQKAVERILLEVTTRWSPRTRLSPRDWVANEQLFADLARNVGFRHPLPASLLKVKTGKVLAAINSGGGGLRPLALVALLGTPGCLDHPFARAATAAPDLLHQLDALGRARDEAGHEFQQASRDSAARDRFHSAINNGVDTAYAAAQYLLL